MRAVGEADQVLVVGASAEDVEDALDELRTQLLVGGPLALLVAVLLGYVVAGSALRPMEQMRARAATISAASSGDRLPVPDVRDEVHRWARPMTCSTGSTPACGASGSSWRSPDELRTPMTG